MIYYCFQQFVYCAEKNIKSSCFHCIITVFIWFFQYHHVVFVIFSRMIFKITIKTSPHVLKKWLIISFNLNILFAFNSRSVFFIFFWWSSPSNQSLMNNTHQICLTNSSLKMSKKIHHTEITLCFRKKLFVWNCFFFHMSFINVSILNNFLNKWFLFLIGWPRRSGSPSEVRRFRADGSSFVTWFRSDPTNRRFLAYFFMRYNVSPTSVTYLASLDIMNEKKLIYICNLPL